MGRPLGSFVPALEKVTTRGRRPLLGVAEPTTLGGDDGLMNRTRLMALSLMLIQYRFPSGPWDKRTGPSFWPRFAPGLKVVTLLATSLSLASTRRLLINPPP